MEITEQPTFFGPPESPLFGVIHLPRSERVREGILLCPSLGKEAADSVRFQRILAGDLAERGFAVLRFDYLGTGDSAFDQGRADALEEWIRSIDYAAQFLRDSGIDAISAVGHRAGALLAEEFDCRAGGLLRRVIHLDPSISGRRYLRQQSALFKIAVGAENAPSDAVAVVGLTLQTNAARRFGALTLDREMAASQAQRLLLLPEGQDNAAVQRVADARGLDTTIVPQMNSTLSMPMPLLAAQTIVSWFDRSAPTATSACAPTYRLHCTLPADGQRHAVREQIEKIGPKQLFAIRSAPQGLTDRPWKTVVFCATFVDPHIGPAREWVEMSRRIAGSGHEAVRWDRAGLGNSPGLHRRQWHQIYQRSDIADVATVARHIGRDAADVCAVGICSGSWYAAHAARCRSVGQVVLINPILWNWRAWSSWAAELRGRRRFASVGDAFGSPSGVDKPGLLGFALRARGRMQEFFHRSLPVWLKLVLCQLGIGRVPESMLAPIARRGVAATVVLGPEDYESFAIQQGPATVARLRNACTQPTVVRAERGDHSAYNPALLDAVRAVIGEVLGAPVDDESIRVSRISGDCTELSRPPRPTMPGTAS